MNILITNDDGIYADGILELAKTLKELGNVYIVAPDSQKSATGHAITVHNPIMVKNIFIDEEIKCYAISGTPADCVKLGIDGLFKDIDFDLVVSGINNGANLGTDVIYSGTVSAAMEGFIQNKPSIAVSYDEFNVSKDVYKKSSKYVLDIINNIKDKMDIFDDCILNINIPSKDIKGIKITTLGDRKYENALEERFSPYGYRYFWVGGQIKQIEQDIKSDISAVENGYISVTPINIDMTNKSKVDILEDLNLL